METEPHEQTTYRRLPEKQSIYEKPSFVANVATVVVYFTFEIHDIVCEVLRNKKNDDLWDDD